jgi:anthranilate phosphoribosyltransferase
VEIQWEESAAVFMNVLQGKGTPAQNAAVVANAGMSLYAGHQDQGVGKAMERAKEALESGKQWRRLRKCWEADSFQLTAYSLGCGNFLEHNTSTHEYTGSDH